MSAQIASCNGNRLPLMAFLSCLFLSNDEPEDLKSVWGYRRQI